MTRALVVSPDAALRGFVRMALGRDWDIEEARNGREALVRFEASHPPLVIAHQISENFGAFGLARELKIDGTPPRVLVLLERPHDQWLAKWSGADRWLVLPAGPFELADAAHDLVDVPASSGPASSPASGSAAG